jgi:ribosome-associated translation inhibitor RaiA
MKTMRLNLQHIEVRSTNALDAWVENQIFSLQPRLQIDEANVRLACHREGSPPYHVRVHLVTPGPDVFAEGNDHTLRAAFGKVMRQLSDKISGRTLKRLQRVRNNQSEPAADSRGRR